MLVLTRKEGESITIGTNIEVIVLRATDGRLRLGIVAPKDVPVFRTELLDKGISHAASKVQADLEADAKRQNEPNAKRQKDRRPRR